MENAELAAVIASPPVAPFTLPATDHAVGTDAASSESTSQPDHVQIDRRERSPFFPDYLSSYTITQNASLAPIYLIRGDKVVLNGDLAEL
jgi:hypothetical protein